jgi:hypothetical protein
MVSALCVARTQSCFSVVDFVVAEQRRSSKWCYCNKLALSSFAINQNVSDMTWPNPYKSPE